MDDQQFAELTQLITVARKYFKVEWRDALQAWDEGNSDVLAAISAQCGPFEFVLRKEAYVIGPPVFSVIVCGADNKRVFYYKDYPTLEEVIQDLGLWIQQAIAALGASTEP